MYDTNACNEINGRGFFFVVRGEALWTGSERVCFALHSCMVH